MYPFRSTDRRESAIHHFYQALSLDPFFWAAYEELRTLAVLAVQKQQLQVPSQDFFACSADHIPVSAKSLEEASPRLLKNIHVKDASGSNQGILQVTSQDFFACNVNHVQVSAKSFERGSPRQLKYINSNSVKDASRSHQGTVISSVAVNRPSHCAPSSLSFSNTPSPMAPQLSAIAPPPVFRNVKQNPSPAGAESSPRSTVNTTLQAPRRKKLRKISGRLLSDSGPRKSAQLSGETRENNAMSATIPTVNGASHSTKYLANSRFSIAGFRFVTTPKGLAWASENFEGGIRHETIIDDSLLNAQASIGPSCGNVRSAEHDVTLMNLSRKVHDDGVYSSALEILLGEGYRLSCMHKCQDALDVYQKLPPKHYNTGWVLSQVASSVLLIFYFNTEPVSAFDSARMVGRAYFELVDYLEADHAFSLARSLCPYSLDGMDVYSTVLYHLKDDLKLSCLAKELLSTDRLAPQTCICLLLCAMGNCYSLQKDHNTAVKNFQRAVQLSPRFAYAHTLCGHEHAASEDFENGIGSFQRALHVDQRHYNAWYGLGMVYLRQEKFEFAEHHFRMAFKTNPSSSVIMSYLGTALHALKRNEEALMMMEKAIIADRKNPLPLFQKAIIFSSMDNCNEALEVLEELKEYAPRECSIYALMGNIYKRKNMHGKAMLNFGLALDLKPAAADVATIKAAIEKLDVPDDFDNSLVS
ncbi:hypothetical protein Cgig2_005560 [Carnegiea gigantea]|uniref:Uncharacterized protein n=1 Tax=Carnegiea gigantea TaxID=171969 RepID=A0A9Q1KVB9_9CARY|nr:hypothetical protein Cgig2_005560 [Carnegiea gigantea]